MASGNQRNVPLDAGAIRAALFAMSGQVNVVSLAILAGVTVYALGGTRR